MQAMSARDAKRPLAGGCRHLREHGSNLVRAGFINGRAGCELQATALEIEDGTVVAVWIVCDPDKLAGGHGRHVAGPAAIGLFPVFAIWYVRMQELYPARCSRSAR